MKRAKHFLEAYRQQGIAYPPRPANLRADHLDEELICLFKAAGCQEIQFGVEHGDPEVFAAIGKGETLDDIREAAKLVKKHGIRLVVSFIIGLPGDSIKKTLASARLARQMDVDECYWNILVAYKGTRAYRYFEAKGILDQSNVPKSWTLAGNEEWPNAETPGFSAEERLKAKHLAEIFSEQMPMTGQIRFVCEHALKYHFWGDLFSLLAIKAGRRIGLAK
jgi:radical SAM superfamily enzyme YgiQ (UPF0313 family)